MKKGISLIVLVITIIVMIILAASVVITLSNTGIINKANEAVDLTNSKQVQDFASLTWSEAYLNNLRGQALINEVKDKLEDNKITEDNWNIDITDKGISVTEKNNPSEPGSGGKLEIGLGSLITEDNYGDTVNYTVTVSGKTYDNWEIYYHNGQYVYLIVAEEDAIDTTLDKGTLVESITSDEHALYEKFRVGNSEKYELIDTASDGSVMNNCQAIAQLIKDYAVFGETTKSYATYVEGAIGSPTIELLMAGWNAKKYSPTLYTTKDYYGYNINDFYYVDVTADEFYAPSSTSYWLASPASGFSSCLMLAGNSAVADAYVVYSGGAADPLNYVRSARPVVCLNANIPATVGTGDYNFTLVE